MSDSELTSLDSSSSSSEEETVPRKKVAIKMSDSDESYDQNETKLDKPKKAPKVKKAFKPTHMKPFKEDSKQTNSDDLGVKRKAVERKDHPQKKTKFDFSFTKRAPPTQEVPRPKPVPEYVDEVSSFGENLYSMFSNSPAPTQVGTCINK